jgi:aspartate carbamoyltransferase catalytic subunit
LRVQKERFAGRAFSTDDYVAQFQVTPELLRLARRDALVMHPGPMIRGMELTDEVADGSQSMVLEQVANGVPVRMAILARALGAA